MIEQLCPTIRVQHRADDRDASGRFVEKRADHENTRDNDDERTMATVAAAEAFAERTDLRILASRGTKSTPSVTDQTIAGRNGIARK